jgi:hypothetical protein
MNSIKKLSQNICQRSSHVMSMLPLRTLWEIWALINVLLILAMVIASIWLPELRNKLSLAVLEMYLGPLPQCKP